MMERRTLLATGRSKGGLRVVTLADGRVEMDLTLDGEVMPMVVIRKEEEEEGWEVSRVDRNGLERRVVRVMDVEVVNRILIWSLKGKRSKKDWEQFIQRGYSE